MKYSNIFKSLDKLNYHWAIEKALSLHVKCWLFKFAWGSLLKLFLKQKETNKSFLYNY